MQPSVCIDEVVEALLQSFTEQQDSQDAGQPDLSQLLHGLRLLVPEKHLQRALTLVEQKQVTELIAAQSLRRLFQARTVKLKLI